MYDTQGDVIAIFLMIIAYRKLREGGGGGGGGWGGSSSSAYRKSSNAACDVTTARLVQFRCLQYRTAIRKYY